MSELQTNPAAAGGNGGDAVSRHPFFSKLRVRLLALVLLAVLPALGLVVYSALNQRRESKKEAIASAQRIVRLAAATHKQHIEAARQLLLTLSQLREMRPDRAADAEALFQSLLQVHTVYVNIGAIDAEGYVFASGLPATNRVYLGDRSYFQVARDTGKFAVGEFQTGRISGKSTLNMALPIRGRDPGRFHGVVFAALDLNWLNQLAARVELPDGSTLTVIDRHGIILVRYSVPEAARDWVGESIGTNQRVMAFLQSGVETVNVSSGLDGVRRLYTSTPLSRTGGLTDAHVIVGIPERVAYAAANHMLAQNLVFLGIVAALALGSICGLLPWAGHRRHRR